MGHSTYARLITVKAKKGKGGQFAKTFDVGIASTAMEIEGLQELYLFSPIGKKDEFLVLSLWDVEQSAKNYVKSGRDTKYGSKLAKFQQGPDTIKKFRVELHSGKAS